jgi:hypothetical protein
MQPDTLVKQDDTLSIIKQKLDAAGDKPEVQANLKRHYEHLENLAASLRKMGMDERTISDEILLVFGQYERALADYFKAA